ncbi:hypothetical protein AWC38_SpisGene9398 [Stylophora pistillata]|uniref:Uncharacterized protein n=1 Tax=Stylophora pistillata TaxID=50429 RepID=A0A2B4S9Z9_STYPI|nr:hypothetical protein AWC38_SpisGene9398 [Stylophora pistillata]
MTKRVAAISIEELRKDVEDGGGVPQLDLETLLQSCHHMPDLVKEKILYEWIKKHLMCFLTLDAMQKVSRQLPRVQQEKLDEEWAMKRAEKRLKDTNLSTVHTHLFKIQEACVYDTHYHFRGLRVITIVDILCPVDTYGINGNNVGCRCMSGYTHKFLQPSAFMKPIPRKPDMDIGPLRMRKDATINYGFRTIKVLSF